MPSRLALFMPEGFTGPAPWLPEIVPNDQGGGGGGAPDAEGDGGDAGDPPSDADMESLRAALAELKLSPGQLRKRLEASRTWEQRAKAAREDQEALEKLRKERLTAEEKAVEEAFAGGRASAVPLLVEAHFEAAAARAGKDADAVGDLLADLNISRFVGEDGQPDKARIAARVASLPDAKPPEPEQEKRHGDLGQGARGGAKPEKSISAGRAAYEEFKNKRNPIRT